MNKFCEEHQNLLTTLHLINIICTPFITVSIICIMFYIFRRTVNKINDHFDK